MNQVDYSLVSVVGAGLAVRVGVVVEMMQLVGVVVRLSGRVGRDFARQGVQTLQHLHHSLTQHFTF